MNVVSCYQERDGAKEHGHIIIEILTLGVKNYAPSAGERTVATHNNH